MDIKSESGFTMIELLVVMAFIGVLAGISISQYGQYKNRAYASVTKSDLRNAMTNLETYVQDNEEYPTCNDATCGGTLTSTLLSDGVQLSVNGNGDESYVAVTCHERGNTKDVFTSIPGVIVSLRTGPCGS